MATPPCSISDGVLLHNTDLVHSVLHPKLMHVFIISTSEGTSFRSIIHSCSQDIVMTMLAKIFKIVNKNTRGVLLTAVVVLQELQNIRYSVRTMITFILSQRLVGQRCNGSRNAAGKREP